jgi:Arc/MetJ-type ribon-helix-helix transcriptional regulator
MVWKDRKMADHRVVLRLNQQQMELVEKTVARGEAANTGELVRRALKEFSARHLPKGEAKAAKVRKKP